MNFREFKFFPRCLFNYKYAYNPTLLQLKNKLLLIRSMDNSNIIDIILDFGYTQDEFNIKFYNWIEYLLQNHADLITLDSTLIDLIGMIDDGNIAYDANFISPDAINNNRRVLSIINKTTVVGYVNDVFVNLKDFDVAFLHCPNGSILYDPFFSRFFNDNELSNKINLIGLVPNIFEFNNIPLNEVINLQPSLEHLNYLFLFDRSVLYEEIELQNIVNNALRSVNNLCPFTKTIVFNGILHPHDNNLNINPLIAAINNFLENNETNFKSIYIISNNRAILN